MSLMKNNGFKGMTGSTVQFSTMIKVQGMKRIIEYMGAMYKGILKKGIKAANAFAAAVNAKDEAAFAKLFDTVAVIEFPAGGKNIAASDFLKGAGKDVKLELKALRSGGWFTSGAVDVTMGGSSKHGVVFFEFSPKTKKMINARFFWN
jgi:hypothetical protein